MAASLGVSLATVRTHIRALFDKTGVRRQAELVRLALAG
jgi:DNA-binding CsgD family transcriptional regulator